MLLKNSQFSEHVELAGGLSDTNLLHLYLLFVNTQSCVFSLLNKFRASRMCAHSHRANLTPGILW